MIYVVSSMYVVYQYHVYTATSRLPGIVQKLTLRVFCYLDQV